MSVRQDSRTKQWYYRFQYKGRDFQEHGFRTSQQAREAETRTKDQAIQGRYFPERQAEGLTLAEGGQWFFENHAKLYKRSWKNDRARIDRIAQFFGRKLMKDVTPEDIEAFLAWVVKTSRGKGTQRLTDNTRNHYLGTVRTIYNRLKMRRKYFGDNPAN